MSDSIYLKKVTSGMIWQMSERVMSALIQFALSTILARLLSPSEYGIISIIMVFITISDILVNAGFGTAIIQHKEFDDETVSSLLWFAMITAAVLYVILFFGSIPIAYFYKEPIVTPVLRLYSLVILANSASGILRSILLKKMQFKKIFVSSLFPMCFSGAAGVLAAVLGLGVYALVIQALIFAFFSTIFLAVAVKWRPKFVLKIKKVSLMLGYSFKLLLSNLIEVGYKNIYPLVIPACFGKAVLGLYTYGRQIPNVLVSTINSSTVSTIFPVFSELQDNLASLKDKLRKTIRQSNYLIFPIMLGIAALSDEVIYILLGDKWAGSGFYLKIFCFIFALFHIQNYNFQAISAIGKSGVFLFYEVVKKVLGIAILFISIPFGMKIVMYGQLILSIIYLVLNIYPNKKYLNYSFKEQLADFLPTFFISALMYAIVLVLKYVLPIANIYIMTVILVLIGVISYVLFSRLFRIKEFDGIIAMIKSLFVKGEKS